MTRYIYIFRCYLLIRQVNKKRNRNSTSRKARQRVIEITSLKVFARERARKGGRGWLKKLVNKELMRSSRALSIDSKDDEALGSTQVSKGRLTLCVVGSGGVGKSSLTVRYLHGRFPEVL